MKRKAKNDLLLIVCASWEPPNLRFLSFSTQRAAPVQVPWARRESETHSFQQSFVASFNVSPPSERRIVIYKKKTQE